MKYEYKEYETSSHFEDIPSLKQLVIEISIGGLFAITIIEAMLLLLLRCCVKADSGDPESKRRLGIVQYKINALL